MCIPGLLHGVTVGEKLAPAGVFNALGVTALIPLSFNIDARPVLTENVEHEFLLDSPDRGVDGALSKRIRFEHLIQLKEIQAMKSLPWLS